jgi:hypothetical protein
MEKEKIKIEPPVSISGVTVIPVTKSSLNYRSGKNNISIFGYKEPVSVVVLSDNMKKAFSVDGEEISLDELTAEIPDIQQLLEKL